MQIETKPFLPWNLSPGINFYNNVIMMTFLGHCTLFDAVVAFIFVVFLVRGVWIGFIRQIASLLGLVGGYLLAGKYSGLLAPYVGKVVADPKINFLISFFLCFLLTLVGIVMVGRGLRKVMEISFLGWFDRLLGVCLGGAKAFMVASILYMVLAATISGTNNLLRSSCSTPYLHLGAEYLQQFIGDRKLRERFVPRKPAIEPEPVLSGHNKKTV